MKFLTLLAILLDIVIAGELIINGNFEDLLRLEFLCQAETYIINIDKIYDEDPDSEVYVERLDRLETAIYQICNLPTPELDFTFKARVTASCSDTSHPAPAVASIILSYLDIDENNLG